MTVDCRPHREKVCVFVCLVTLGDARGPYGIPGTEPRPALCKAISLTPHRESLKATQTGPALAQNPTEEPGSGISGVRGKKNSDFQDTEKVSAKGHTPLTVSKLPAVLEQWKKFFFVHK